MVVQAKGLDAPSRADRRAIVKDVCIDRWIEVLFQHEDKKKSCRYGNFARAALNSCADE
jgi:hypothetical protein